MGTEPLGFSEMKTFIGKGRGSIPVRFNNLHGKLMGVLLLLLFCTVILGTVALWGVSSQGKLLGDVAGNVRGVMDQTGGLTKKLLEAVQNANRTGEMAGQLGEQFNTLQQLFSDMDVSAQLARENNLSALAGITLQLIDRRMDAAKFLADAAVKARDVRDRASGFYYAGIKDREGSEDSQSYPDGDPYEDREALNDYMSALVSSANADFYVILGLSGAYRGKGLYSDTEDLFDADLSGSTLFKAAIRENRITKSLDRIGDDLVVGAAAFLKSSEGKDLGVVICGYKLDVNTLRFLSEDLKAHLALFIADGKGNLSEARYSTLVDRKGEPVTEVPLPEGLVEDFTQKLRSLRERAKNAGETVDGLSIRSDFLRVVQSEIGGLTYVVGYQALLTDDAGLLGILAIARDASEVVAQHREILKKAAAAIQNVEKIETSRWEIQDAGQKGQREAGELIEATRETGTKLDAALGKVARVY